MTFRVRIDTRRVLRELRVLDAVMAALRALGSGLPEILTASAFVAGWLLITKGIADLTRPQVWPISIGLLLLSLCGWSLIRTIFVRGLYLLNVKERGAE